MVCVSFRRGKRLKVLEMLDFLVQIWYNLFMKNETIFYKGIMPSEKILDLPVDCNFLTGSVNL